MLKIFCSPSRYIQGPEASQALGRELARMGIAERPLIIAGATAWQTLAPSFTASFAAAAIPLERLEFAGECATPEIDRCTRTATERGSSCIVGAGGGKVLDTARAVASALGLPVVCCPTIAASDAPCSALSVIYTPDGVFERCLFHRRNPDLVLVDTRIIARAPVRYLVAGMGDALATWFEAETTQRACKPNTVGGADTLAALAIARLCYDTLLADGEAACQAVRRGAVTPALERIVEANVLLSGLGFESGGLAVAHAVHNGLTALPATHAHLHGEKVAFGTLVQLVLEGRPQTQIDEVLGFCALVGLPLTLAALGLEQLTQEQARLVAERAVASGETSHNEPFELSWTAVRDALLAADAVGHAFLQRASQDVRHPGHR
ncbi:MAG: glycerol dehydrogenase [Sphingobacteriia bacterium]|nr:glycerol dehydrogenase [Sphingobacteriia bacterium]NCC41238.1 glycerol dehydrogenase [Gammaproteobacteria bacterium]